MKAADMPKILSPFKREIRDGIYVVTPQIEEGYEWVFTDPSVKAVEKLDGTNVSIIMNAGKVVGLWNRQNPQVFDTLNTNRFIEGIRNCPNLGHALAKDGQHFGELMGPHVQTNFLELEKPTWFPFTYLQEKASYKSFHKYEKTFDNISSWFKDHIFSLMSARLHEGDKRFPEGIVFTHPDGRMAKLRRDMFDWYKGRRHGFSGKTQVAPLAWKPLEIGDPVLCEHANENPMVCTCPDNCYCQTHTCKEKKK